ncbi:PTS-dependent dihydroxyacetone kinase, ADP-binding subunit DhaL [Oxobacter pfennigii]|uniref:phosphoenolpyruvate--glycerone phosphotransferase n=1 Tax=Oxobacter pfennigii TaxID=36849 RepID=A0A0P8WAQ7_9CLOT|nr:dihydroxyacetone kinase subunit DhaL [Oxobacter pfennigii]KPU45707.1 PTS-dependent dihydroxyacetone kinase, ADP-binding subunit DhaL [Oxobacter pfennigii]
MGFQLSSKDYAEYIKLAAAKIHENGDYVTALDSATGDGDHWSNINMGFEKLVEAIPELEAMNLFDEFKKIGMIMMSVIGGSSGVLYGSAYIGAAKVLKNRDIIENQDMCNILEAMLEAIMARGNAQPGFKTMIDSLHPAVECYKDCIAKGLSEKKTLSLVKSAAVDGAQSTAAMEAVRGRACYQSNKGIGHLDPGAVTMSYQIETLMDYIAARL